MTKYDSWPTVDAGNVVGTRLANEIYRRFDGLMASLSFDDQQRASLTELLATTDETLNVKSFGAVGDGVTDDAAAIQAAIDAIEAGDGGVLVLPAGGSFALGSTSLVIDAANAADLWVYAHGATITKTTAGPFVTLDGSASTSATHKRPKVMGGRWVGSGAADECFRLICASGTTFRDVYVEGVDLAMRFRNTDSRWTENVIVDGSKFVNCDRVAEFEVVGGDNSFARTRFTNIFVSGGAVGGYWFYGNTDAAVYDSLFSMIGGNATSGLTALVRVGDADWGGTRIENVLVESAGAYNGIEVVSSSANGPMFSRYDLRNATTAVTGSGASRIRATVGTDWALRAQNLYLNRGADTFAAGDNNDYDAGDVVVLSATADASGSALTGIAGEGVSARNGRLLAIVNVSTNTLTIEHEDTGSTAANRITTPTGAALSLGQYDAAVLYYEGGGDQRWRILSFTG